VIAARNNVEAVQVKVYGLLPMTRERYLRQVAAAVVLAVGILTLWWTAWPAVRSNLETTPASDWVRRLIDVAPWIIVAALVQQSVESWIVLRRFAQKESARKQALDELERRESNMAAQHSPRFLQLVQEAKKHIRETTADEVKKRLDAGEKLTIIDVREESEYARDHLPGAIHLGKGILERDVESKFPDPSAELILYCGGGFRSALAADNLVKMGYTNAVSMDGGVRDWRGKGYPLTSS
jgi:rhodanese-related sulfurtransferase